MSSIFQLYGIFAISLALAVYITAILPVFSKINGSGSYADKHKVLYSIIMILYIVVFAPFFVPLMLSDSKHQRFVSYLEKTLLEDNYSEEEEEE